MLTKPLTSFALFALLLAAAPSFADAGVAIAIAKDKQDNRDLEYFIRYDRSSTGFQLEKSARQDFQSELTYNRDIWRSYPSSRNSGDLRSGYFAVIRYDDPKGKSTYALGFDTTPEGAEIEAEAELKRRNWNWTSRKGYRIDRSGRF